MNTNLSRTRFIYSAIPSFSWILVMGFVGGVSALSQDYQEPALPVATASHQGYFPTLADSALLRGPYDSRSQGLGLAYEEGPDVRQQIGSDIFPYLDAEPNFYQRNDDFFRPLDHFLGVFTPHDAVTVEADSLDNTSLTLDARMGVLTRRFSPDLAMVKAGPLFFDLLWVGAGVIYSDYNGPRNFGPDNGDGWTGYLDFGVRGLLRLTDTIYLSAVGNFIYLPFENRIAFRFGSGRESGALARLQYSESFGAWDLLIYDEFKGRPGLNWWGQATVDGRDRAGRYFFGFPDNSRTNEFYNENFVVFINTVGVKASRLVFGNQWRLWVDADHTDFWRSYVFRNHRTREHAGVALGYEGSVIPFAPLFTYDMYSVDKFNSLQHVFMSQFTGRLSENLDWIGKFGYMVTSGTRTERDRWLWEVGLNHNLTKNTRHWIRVGEGFFDNELQAETLTSRFVRWGIDQRIDRRLYMRAFVQLSDRETLNPGVSDRDRFAVGFDINFQPLDFTQLRASLLYEQIERGAGLNDSDHWVYRLEAIQQLGLRLTGHLFYQYEERQVAPRSFQEHLIGMSIRRYF